MVFDTNLKDYYARRAKEYEDIYQKTERQKDIHAVKEILRNLLAGRDVLEIACGTGFWTEAIAESARSILATDINEEVLEIAESKSYPPGKVRFRRADALSPQIVPGQFTAAFAGFWISHLPKSELKKFLQHLHAKLSPGGIVVLIDNLFVEGSSTPIHRADAGGNTYQLRRLGDGSRHEILKNFLTADDFAILLDDAARNVRFVKLEYFWCLSYEPRSVQ